MSIIGDEGANDEAAPADDDAQHEGKDAEQSPDGPAPDMSNTLEEAPDGQTPEKESTEQTEIVADLDILSPAQVLCYILGSWGVALWWCALEAGAWLWRLGQFSLAAGMLCLVGGW